MKVGLSVLGIGAGTTAEAIATIAIHAERLGFATLYGVEHVTFVMGASSRYPYSETGAPPGSINLPVFDPWPTLAYAAALTKRIRLGTGIALVPEHHPLALAKTIATVDQLSGGRVMLGVGIGWLEEEFQALGIPWQRRAQRTCEYIQAMRRLWSDEVTSFHGEFVHFDKAISFPKPLLKEKLPVIFGGNTPAALRRVAKHGSGWYGLGYTPDTLAATLQALRETIAGSNRKAEEVEVIVGPSARQPSSDDFKKFRDQGVSELVIGPWGPRRDAQEHIKRLEDMARNWVEPINALS